MSLSPENVALIAAGAALIFWPQISPMLKQFKMPAGGKPAEPAGTDRTAAVGELLKLQDVSRALGKPKAADLIGSAIVEIVTEAKR